MSSSNTRNTSISAQLSALKTQPDASEYDHSVLRLLNERYSTWDDLVRLPEGSGSGSSSGLLGSSDDADEEQEAAEEYGEAMQEQEDGWELDVDLDDVQDEDDHPPNGSERNGDRRKVEGLTVLELEIRKWEELERSSFDSVRPSLFRFRPSCW